MTAADRADRTAAADLLCQKAFESAGGGELGVALVAVGGFGRGELAPFSDLDVVLVADDGVGIGELAESLWYPLWDSGAKLDHAVRGYSEMLEAAAGDIRVASGLLDLRHIAGDPNLALRLRTTVLTAWRRHARERLPELRELVLSRHRVVGELAHLSVPDIKEAEGGLRDATVLKSLAATWLVDVPATDLEHSRQQMLDIRDLLHQAAGRGTDRIGPEHWTPIAEGLGLPDERSAQKHVREVGRQISHLSRLVWRRTDDALRRTPAAKPRRPDLAHLAPGVAMSQGEVVLAKGANPAADPVLLLRAAAEAAARDLVLAPATAARLAREGLPLPDPWPDEARQQFVRLLAAGPGLLAVWETLEQTGALDAILPEWERIRLLPHASVIHRFTVDRHSVETCIEASALIRDVSRPDVLMVAALLHDIGKGGVVEHCRAGAPIARAIAARMGFDAESVELIERLVRRHLLLSETATTRDPDDPATVDVVVREIEDAGALALLTALTEADARATSAKAWSSWRARLIRDLSGRANRALQGNVSAADASSEEIEIDLDTDGVLIRVERVADGSRVTVATEDRVGLLADTAAMFALRKVPVRAARAWAQGEIGISIWEVDDDALSQGMLHDQFAAIVSRRVDPEARLAARAAAGARELAPTVVVRPEASQQATVLEVRAADRVGVVYQVCAALASLDLSVRSAHVSTLGPQAVDVFYVQEVSAGALSETRAADAVRAVRERLAPED